MFTIFKIIVLTFIAFSAERYPITKPVTLTNWRGANIQVDQENQLSFEIVVVGESNTRIKVFNAEGETAGSFSISSDDLQKIINSRIQTGLNSAAKGAEGKKPGCCDVEQPKKSRAPAIVENPPLEEEISVPAQGSQSGVCKFYQNFLQKGVPEKALQQALRFYEKNPDKIKNRNIITIADYSANSRTKRFYLLDLASGAVTNKKVSHGGAGTKYGDPNHDGMLDACKRPNGVRTNMTRAGFFTTGSLGYSKGKSWPKHKKQGKNLNFLSLNARSPGINDDAYGYVMHEARFNAAGDAKMGRSHGCPTFVPGEGFSVWEKIQGGSLYYSYAPVCADDHEKVLEQIPNWEKICK